VRKLAILRENGRSECGFSCSTEFWATLGLEIRGKFLLARAIERVFARSARVLHHARKAYSIEVSCCFRSSSRELSYFLKSRRREWS